MKALIAVASFALAATTVSAVSNVAQSTLLGMPLSDKKVANIFNAFSQLDGLEPAPVITVGGDDVSGFSYDYYKTTSGLAIPITFENLEILGAAEKEAKGLYVLTLKLIDEIEKIIHQILVLEGTPGLGSYYDTYNCSDELKFLYEALFKKEKELATVLVATDELIQALVLSTLPDDFCIGYKTKGLASSFCDTDSAWFLSGSHFSRPTNVNLADLIKRLEAIEELTVYAIELSERALFLIVKIARLLEKILLLGNVAPKLDWSTPVGGYKPYAGYHYDNELVYVLKELAIADKELAETIRTQAKVNAKVQHLAFGSSSGKYEYSDYWCYGEY